MRFLNNLWEFKKENLGGEQDLREYLCVTGDGSQILGLISPYWKECLAPKAIGPKSVL